MNRYYISVIIPVYNPQYYIYECLQSLLEQTIDKSLFEVIIVLNGEKEPFYEDLKAFVKGYDNFKIVYSQDLGVSNARNYGLDYCQGTHILFIDDDDFIAHTFLQSCFDIIEERYDSIMVGCFYKYYDDKRLEKDYMTDFILKKSNESQNKFSLISNRRVLSSCCGKLIPKNVIANSRFDKNVKISEDALFMFAISKNISNIVYLPHRVIYYRRIRSESHSNRKKSVLSRLGLLLSNLFNFSKIYFSDISKYSFVLYINRLLAISKHFLLSFKK